MSGEFRFQKLTVWQKSIGLAQFVYELTEKFPSSERFGLINQMRRAAVSVSSNIAEGAGRSSDSDFARFLQIAYGSLMEVVSQLHLSTVLKFCRSEDIASGLATAEEIAKLLSGLRVSLVGSKNHSKN